MVFTREELTLDFSKITLHYFYYLLFSFQNFFRQFFSNFTFHCF
ncbi:hypothetical protein JOE25_002794 [Serratia sp. PL17]|nr:hypothetical protein [Serratia sp. PL17]